MSYHSVAQRIHEARFDLTVDEVVDLLADLHRLHAAGPPAESAELHPELVEQCVEALFDLFALDQVPPAVVAGIIDDITQDWPETSPGARAAMIASLNALAQAHPIPTLLGQHASPAATEVLSRLGR